MVNCPSVIALTRSQKFCAASSKTAKPSGTDVTIVSVRLPWAYAGAASVAAAAVAPTPTVEFFKKERRSIKSPPEL